VLSRASPLEDETPGGQWYVGTTTDLGEVGPEGGRSHREAVLMCDNCDRIQDAEGDWHESREFVLRHWPVSLARCPFCGDL
jgi:hypothetical protein